MGAFFLSFAIYVTARIYATMVTRIGDPRIQQALRAFDRPELAFAADVLDFYEQIRYTEEEEVVADLLALGTAVKLVTIGTALPARIAAVLGAKGAVHAGFLIDDLMAALLNPRNSIPIIRFMFDPVTPVKEAVDEAFRLGEAFLEFGVQTTRTAADALIVAAVGAVTFLLDLFQFPIPTIPEETFTEFERRRQQARRELRRERRAEFEAQFQAFGEELVGIRGKLGETKEPLRLEPVLSIKDFVASALRTLKPTFQVTPPQLRSLQDFTILFGKPVDLLDRVALGTRFQRGSIGQIIQTGGGRVPIGDLQRIVAELKKG